MVARHLNELKNQTNADFSLDLLVGMTGVDGLAEHSMLGFKSIPRQSAGSRFGCRFTLPGKSIHSKVYVWSKDSVPFRAWAGSANYTQIGFGLSKTSPTHHEAMVEVDPRTAFDYVLDSSPHAIDYLDPDVSIHLQITKELPLHGGNHALEHSTVDEDRELTAVVLPLVKTKLGVGRGEVHEGGGLNWGQRGTRDRNQAYIPIPSRILALDFFPPLREQFQLLTDDGDSFIATVAQEQGKAIETPHNNSLLGQYFRRRLGVPMDSFVTTADLARFGSNGVEIQRVDEGLYRLVFQPGIQALE